MAGVGQIAIGNGVVKPGGAVEVGGGGEGDRACSQHHGAVGRVADLGYRKGVQVNIGVVGEQGAVKDLHRGVLVGLGGVIHCHRGVIDRSHRDSHMAGVGQIAIGNGVVKPGSASEVELGGEGDCACSQGHCATRCIADFGQAEGVAIGIGVIGQQGAVQDVDGSVLVGRGRVIHRHRGIIDITHGDSHVSRVGLRTVADGVVKPGGAVEVELRREGDCACSQGHRAVRGVADPGHRQGVQVNIGVVGEQDAVQDLNGGVLIGRGGVVHRHRGIIDCHDRDDYMAGVGRRAVGDDVVKPGFAIEVRRRREGDGLSNQGQGAVRGVVELNQGKDVAVDIGVVGEQGADLDVDGSVLVG